jgi:hypothetical protein
MVETITVPIIDGVLDSGVTRWKENVSDDNPYAYILRVYCTNIKDPYPSTFRIGMKLLNYCLNASLNHLIDFIRHSISLDICMYRIQHRLTSSVEFTNC